jgi:hypothetical protein
MYLYRRQGSKDIFVENSHPFSQMNFADRLGVLFMKEKREELPSDLMEDYSPLQKIDFDESSMETAINSK